MFDVGRAPRASWLVAAVAAAALPVSVVACDSAGPEKGVDVDDVTDGKFFQSGKYVGQTVTVSADVKNVHTPTSFELDTAQWGDDSLLVVSGNPLKELSANDTIKVTGTVREFNYDQYVTEYGLAQDETLYEPYDNEQFLVAKNVDQTISGEKAG